MFTLLSALYHIYVILHRCLDLFHHFRARLNWRPTSPEQLDQAEAKILSYLKCLYKTYYVDIGKDNLHIWTLEVPARRASTHQPSTALPLVLMHGIASGLAMWSLNLDELSQNGRRAVYAFDLLGFAKSSRPHLAHITTAAAMEQYLVKSIEQWRRRIGGPLTGKFILLGHSFGGYLASAYALQYPRHVAHLILVEPWGFPVDRSHLIRDHTAQLPFWLRLVGRIFLNVLTPLAVLRAAGPWGPVILEALRPDLNKKFARLTVEVNATTSEGNEDCSASSSEGESSLKASTADLITSYLYHCNAHHQPSGEIAFRRLTTATGLPRLPMLPRIIELSPCITLSFIYGSRSWTDRQSGYQTRYLLPTMAEVERVAVHIMLGSGHHVYADDAEQFNGLVKQICAQVEGHCLN